MIDNIGFGSASIASLASSYKVNNLLRQTYKAGIRHFDTAPLYSQGYAELLIGNFIKPRRQEVTITTKFGYTHQVKPSISEHLALPLNYIRKKIKGHKQTNPAHTTTTNQAPPHLSERKIDKSNIEQSLKGSLERLKTDYIDYYFLHEGLPHFLTEDAMQYLLDLRVNGIVKKIGIATNAHHINTLDNTAVADWDVLQYEYSEERFKSFQEKFPGKIHMHHSCFVNTDINKEASYSGNNTHSQILYDAVTLNPEGKTIFSTRNVSRLKDNLQKLY